MKHNTLLSSFINNNNRNLFKIYFCGVTLSRPPHWGNVRCYLSYDLIRRILREFNANVLLTSNYTDIAQAIYDSSQEGSYNAPIFTSAITGMLEPLLRRLRVSIDRIYRVTEHLPVIIEHVQTLVSTGKAVVTPEGVRHLIQNETEHAFLWRAREDGYESPFGRGIPGWHIECTTMIRHNLHHVHLHGGGRDLIRPHHENEQLIYRDLFGTEIADNWIHNGLALRVDSEKFSKSLGDVLVDPFTTLEEYSPEVVRLWILNRDLEQDGLLDETALRSTKTYLNRLRSRYETLINNNTLAVQGNFYERALNFLDRLHIRQFMNLLTNRNVSNEEFISIFELFNRVLLGAD